MDTKQKQKTWVCVPAPESIVECQETPVVESRTTRKEEPLLIVIQTENYTIEIEFD